MRENGRGGRGRGEGGVSDSSRGDIEVEMDQEIDRG